MVSSVLVRRLDLDAGLPQIDGCFDFGQRGANVGRILSQDVAAHTNPRPGNEFQPHSIGRNASKRPASVVPVLLAWISAPAPRHGNSAAAPGKNTSTSVATALEAK